MRWSSDRWRGMSTASKCSTMCQPRPATLSTTYQNSSRSGAPPRWATKNRAPAHADRAVRRAARRCTWRRASPHRRSGRRHVRAHRPSRRCRCHDTTPARTPRAATRAAAGAARTARAERRAACRRGQANRESAPPARTRDSAHRMPARAARAAAGGGRGGAAGSACSLAYVRTADTGAQLPWPLMDFAIPDDISDYLVELDEFIEHEIVPLEQVDDNVRFSIIGARTAAPIGTTAACRPLAWEELLAEARRSRRRGRALPLPVPRRARRPQRHQPAMAIIRESTSPTAASGRTATCRTSTRSSPTTSGCC